MFAPQILFAGFFIRTSLLPVFLRWAENLCALKYAINLVLLTEFDPSNLSCQGDAESSCATLLTANGIDSKMIYVYILIMAALFIGFRILGAFILVNKARKFY